ncbi:RICIN domain-containing protein [Kitasatospora sp. NPDC093806]|uniref:RICIN domain-containing protein n=1 Tax=Kitasatospora sp. NPDC093806 TaxID=3155075 RepID=UPI00341FB22F
MAIRPLSRTRRLGAALGGLATTGALVLAAPGAAQAEQIPRTTLPFELRNQATGKCLEVADWRTDGGAPIRQWTCTGGANQLWRADSNGLLFNLNSGMCLDVPGGSTVWGTQVIQWPCRTRPTSVNQMWNVPGISSPSTGQLGSWLSLLLDVAGSSPDDGTPIITWGSNGGANQIWHGLEPRVNF